MADPRIKTIKIQTGVLKRLTKEKVSYEKEVDVQRAKIEKYKEEGRDECFINKQGEVLQESVSMVYDCQRRLAKAFQEFKTIIDSELDLKETEDYITAVQILEEAKPHLPK